MRRVHEREGEGEGAQFFFFVTEGVGDAFKN